MGIKKWEYCIEQTVKLFLTPWKILWFEQLLNNIWCVQLEKLPKFLRIKTDQLIETNMTIIGIQKWKIGTQKCKNPVQRWLNDYIILIGDIVMVFFWNIIENFVICESHTTKQLITKFFEKHRINFVVVRIVGIQNYVIVLDLVISGYTRVEFSTGTFMLLF